MRLTAITITLIGLLLLLLSGCTAEVSGTYSSKPIDEPERVIKNMTDQVDVYYIRGSAIQVFEIEDHKYMVYDGNRSGNLIHAQSCENDKHIVIKEGIN